MFLGWSSTKLLFFVPVGYSTKGTCLLSLVPIGLVVSEKKLEM
jgi:hypothetical protein